MLKDFKNEVEISVSIQRLIAHLVKSVLEKPFLERLQVLLEWLLKQERYNSVLTLKSFHQKT